MYLVHMPTRPFLEQEQPRKALFEPEGLINRDRLITLRWPKKEPFWNTADKR